ncbi:MAG TPA: hypothetical protein VFR97_05760 [Capillimicrobium sp.]|nr:hypothetical protein [Capillimicrobium sp.]
MTRKLAATIAAVAAVLACAAPAGAASLTYIKDHDVWISNPDGSGAVRVTHDGTADEPWDEPTMSDDGTIAAVKGFHVHLLRQNGEEIRSFVPGNPPGETTTSGTSSVRFSPDGTKLAYMKVGIGCGDPSLCDLRGISSVMDLKGNILATQEEYTGAFPSWVDDDRILSHGGYRYQNMIWNWRTGDWVNWFDDGDIVAPGNDTDLGDGEISDNHKSYVAIRGYGDNLAVATYAVNGDLAAANPLLPTMLCFATGVVSHPTVSGDGSTAYWEEPDGVWSMAVSPECPNSAILIPGASAPEWSAAKVAPGPKAKPSKAKQCKKLKGKARKRCLKRARG